MKKRFVLGITGGIASGKTTVMRLLARRGIPTVSSDDLAHACIRRGHPAYSAIVRHFGRGILSNGQISRARLGRIVFSDPKKRKRLEQLVHPCVVKGLKRFIAAHRRATIALDIPLLFESRLTRLVDKTLVVYCSPAQQLARLRLRTKWPRREALLRIRAQMPIKEKRKKADMLLLNTGSKGDLRKRLTSLWRQV